MRDATYVDVSGSMATVEKEEVVRYYVKSLLRFYFDNEVYENDDLRRGPTDFACVFTHARTNSFKSITVVTDGYAPGFGIQPHGLDVEWIKV